MGLLITAQLVSSARSTFFAIKQSSLLPPAYFASSLLPFGFFFSVLYWVQFPLVTIILLRERF